MRESVLDNYNEGTSLLVEALQHSLVVLLPAHSAIRHVASPRTVSLLTDHALVVALLFSILSFL